ncbi:hypothetical protein DACRYDRAFT_41625, partial [Dacryopinax primogenitus]
ETAAWGAVADVPTGDVVKDTIRKEKVIKDILAAQEDLRIMLSRVQTVQSDIDKLKSDNATLQMYIDNLTRQMARR